MRKPRFISSCSSLSSDKETVPPAPVPGVLVDLSEHYHHLHDVLRLQHGSEVELFLPDCGCCCSCRLLTVSGGKVQGEIRSVEHGGPERRVILAVAWVKQQKAELIVEKAVELGAAAVHFFRAERSRPVPRDLRSRMTRMERIRDAAVEQSYTLCYPGIISHPEPVVLLQSLHAKQAPQAQEARIIFTAPQGTGHFPAALSENAGRARSAESFLERHRSSADFYIIVGPEGGFCPGELELFHSFGYSPASLGPNILRTETAAILACGLVQLA